MRRESARSAVVSARFLAALVVAGCGASGQGGELDAARDAMDAHDAIAVTSRDVAAVDATRDAMLDATRDATVDATLDVANDVAPAPLVVAIIGDYGVCGAYQRDGTPTEYAATCADEQAVAALVHSWNPDAIVTTGDDSYGSGATYQLPGDQAPYDDYIHSDRFFPAFGNHDWLSSTGLAPSLAYFAPPGRYYAHAFGTLLTAYVTDTNPQEPDGDSATSVQADWLRAQLAARTTVWNVGVNHQAPYSSCGEFSYDGTNGMPDYRWVAAPGIDLQFSGHSHVYERLARANVDGSATIPYVVIGSSGAPLQGNCGVALPGQQRAIYRVFGAVKLVVDAHTLTATFVGLGADGGGATMDTVTLTK